MKEKGISDFIATILLVAFAVAIGGLVSIWLTQTVSKSTGSVEVSNATLCAGASIVVNEVTSTNITFSNPTQQNITSITVMTNTGTTFAVSTATLTPSQIAGQNWTRTGTSVTLRGLCRASIPISGTCELGEACWK